MNFPQETLSAAEIMKDSVILDYIDQGVVIGLMFLYIMYRMLKSESFSLVKMCKGNLRSWGVFFLFFSAISNVISTLSIIYLSYFYEIDKSHLQKIGHLTGAHLVEVFGRKLDLVTILNMSLSLSQIFKISALFILIGLWLPCAFNFAISGTSSYQQENNKNIPWLTTNLFYTQKNLAEAISHAQIVRFATLYAFIRIPFAILLDLNYNYTPEKTMIFYRSIFYGSEIYLAVLFFLILETRFLSILQKDCAKTKGKSVENVNFLTMLLICDGLMRYYINIMAIPIETNPLTLHILKKISFLIEISVNLMLVSMFCPLSKQIYEKSSDSSKIDKPFWSPKNKPSLGSSNKNGTIMISEIHSPVEVFQNTEVVEFNEHRESVVESK